MLIGITGRTKNNCIARSGKTTVASEIKRLTGALLYNFSDPMYEMVKAGFGIDGRSKKFDIGSAKNDPIDWLSSDSKKISLRYILETLGTGWGRGLLADDIWLRCADRFLSNNNDMTVVICDVRFKNEAEWIRKNGGTMIHVCRPNYEYIPPVVTMGMLDRIKSLLRVRHKSNKALPINKDDHVIINNTTIGELKIQTRSVLEDIIRSTHKYTDISYTMSGTMIAHQVSKK